MSNSENAQVPSNSSNELLPCPFCGCIDLHGPHLHDGENGYAEVWIECKQCTVNLTIESADKTRVVAAWNRRAPAHETKLPQSKFDLAFEILKQMEAEKMDTMQSVHFGYVLRVEREKERRCTCGMAVIPEGELRMEVGSTTHRLAGPCFQTVQRHPRNCGCTSCHYSQKFPQVKPHHETCGCFECSGQNGKSQS